MIRSTVFPGVTWPLSGPCARLISAAIVINACSTFVALLALVSKKGICNWSANSYSNTTYHVSLSDPKDANLFWTETSILATLGQIKVSLMLIHKLLFQVSLFTEASSFQREGF